MHGQVYEKTVKPALRQVMDGPTCNFFAYRHSGSGKTHTISGYENHEDQHLGLCLSATQHTFQAIEEYNDGTISEGSEAGNARNELGVAVRLYEVQGKSTFDLSNGGAECHIREGPDRQTHVRGKTEVLEDGKVRVRSMSSGNPC